jgi:hypothetical protein
MAILFMSCNLPDSSSNSSQRIRVTIDDEKELNYSQVFSNINYVQLKIPKDSVVGNIGKVFFSDGYIGLIDRRKRSVWIFNTQGEYINEIPVRIGRGPGEVLTFSDADFGDGNEVLVLGAYRINTFNFEGELKNEVQLPLLTRSFKYIKGQNSYVAFMNNEIASPKGEANQGLYNLYTFDNNGEVVDRFLPFKQEKADLSRLLISNFYSFDGKLHHFSFLNNQIYQIQGPNKIESKYTLDYGEEKISEKVFQKKPNYETGLSFLRNEIYPKNFVLVNAVMETARYLIVGINYGENSGYLFFNKASKEIKITESSRFHNDFIPGLNLYFHLSYNNFIYGIKPAEEVVHKIRSNANLHNDALVNLADKLSQNDGPVLIKAELK